MVEVCHLIAIVEFHPASGDGVHEVNTVHEAHAFLTFLALEAEEEGNTVHIVPYAVNYLVLGVRVQAPGIVVTDILPVVD